MVPDDLIKPPHISIAVDQLTPVDRPDALTDDAWQLIVDCAEARPDFDAVEIYEWLAEEEGHDWITLPMILFVLVEEWDFTASPPTHRRRR
jgi:hypothetical protein